MTKPTEVQLVLMSPHHLLSVFGQERFTSTRVSMGLTDSRKTGKNLVDSRKN